MKKNKKYDIIIYTSLLGAIFFIILGSMDHIKDFKEDGLSFSVSEQKEETKKPVEQNPNAEPIELQSEDKNILVKKYIDSVLDQIEFDSLIDHEMVETWGNYEIISTIYEKEIAEDYYSYYTNIKIPNLNAVLPVSKNEELSTKEYIVITIKANILNSEERNGLFVKKLDPLTEN